MSFPPQDNDLKQYLENCGNLMSVHNVKVRGVAGPSPAPHPNLGVFWGWGSLAIPFPFSSLPFLMLPQRFPGRCHPK